MELSRWARMTKLGAIRRDDGERHGDPVAIPTVGSIRDGSKFSVAHLRFDQRRSRPRKRNLASLSHWSPHKDSRNVSRGHRLGLAACSNYEAPNNTVTDRLCVRVQVLQA